MLRFTIDNTVYKNPLNWKDTAHTWRRDEDNRLYLLEIETIYEWIDDAYDYLKSQRDAGFCGDVDVTIELQSGNVWETIHTGKIFIPAVEFDIWQRIARAKVSDDGFAALIKENKKQIYDLSVGRSKNDSSISACTETDVFFHTVTTGTHDATNPADLVTCHRVEDVFTFLVAAMSDGAMSFSSTIFGSGGTYDGLCITTGQRIYDKASSALSPPVISFEDFFKEVNNIVRIWGYIDNSSGTPTLTIEDEDSFYGTVAAATLNNVRVLSTGTEIDKLYNTVKFGSVGFRRTGDIPSGGSALSFPDNEEWFGWELETFNINGVCGIDRELDLRNEYKCDSNSIENIRLNGALTDGDEDFENIFFVMVDLGTPNQTQATDFILDGNYYYNENINNSAIGDNWICSLAADLVLYLGANSNGCDVNMATDDNYTGVSSNNIINFDTEVSDPGNNFNNATYRYTAPADGAYTFHVQIGDVINNTYDPTNSNDTAKFYFNHYDSGGTPRLNQLMKTMTQDQYSTGSFRIVPGTPYLTRWMLQNDYVNIDVDTLLAVSDIDIKTTDSFFRVINAPDDGGIYNVCEDDTIKFLNYTFGWRLTKSEFDSIINNQTRNISFNGITAWTKRIKYNYWTGDTEFELITDLSNES